MIYVKHFDFEYFILPIMFLVIVDDLLGLILRCSVQIVLYNNFSMSFSWYSYLYFKTFSISLYFQGFGIFYVFSVISY